MSRHDYTKHSKKNQNEVEEELEVEIVEPSVEVETEKVIEPEQEPEIRQAVETKEFELGAVSGCDRLRVRSEPRFGSDVICELECGTTVMIDRSQSTFDYYKIYTEAGVEGFCVKKYIA